MNLFLLMPRYRRREKCRAVLYSISGSHSSPSLHRNTKKRVCRSVARGCGIAIMCQEKGKKARIQGGRNKEGFFLHSSSLNCSAAREARERGSLLQPPFHSSPASTSFLFSLEIPTSSLSERCNAPWEKKEKKVWRGLS